MQTKSGPCAWDEPPGVEGRLGRLERALRCAVARGCAAHADCSGAALDSLLRQLESPEGRP